jgi:hypothetical protein
MHVLTATARVPEKKVQIVVTPRPQPEAETKTPKKQRKKGETTFSFSIGNYKKTTLFLKEKSEGFCFRVSQLKGHVIEIF